MKLKIVKSRAVKVNLIRCNIEMLSDEGNITEYEIVVNTEDFTQMSVDGGVTEMRIDIPTLQEEITGQVMELFLTGGVANALNSRPIEWVVTNTTPETEVVSDDSISTDS